jgi:Xaa-Pro aminopeptidase
LDGLVNEGGAADMLYEFRRQSSEFLMESFAAISAYGPNAAIVHYHHSAGGGAILGDRDLYLIDSGAHYKCGTTDVTRTVHLGVPSQEQKEWYTLVLKGHIALAQAVFPKGTSGGQLDVLARVPIWSKRADYAHGTGHGVGHVLSVHEGPMAIAPRGVASAVALSPGMVLSNEPGVYYAEAFGIRFESLMVVVEDEREGWLKFEVLTLVPIQMALVAQEMLSAEEMSWIMRYNTRVITEISAGLDRTVLDWLRGYCFQ